VKLRGAIALAALADVTVIFRDAQVEKMDWVTDPDILVIARVDQVATMASVLVVLAAKEAPAVQAIDRFDPATDRADPNGQTMRTIVQTASPIGIVAKIGATTDGRT
jgi:hypothetical protein